MVSLETPVRSEMGRSWTASYPPSSREVEHRREHPSPPGGLGALQATAGSWLLGRRVRHGAECSCVLEHCFVSKPCCENEESALRSPRQSFRQLGSTNGRGARGDRRSPTQLRAW